MRRFLFLCALAAAVTCLSACKTVSNGSAVSSLTPEELAQCSFTGQRWMYIVAPEPSFQMDTGAAENLFRSFTDTVLVSDSKLGEALKNASDTEYNACIEYRKQSLGKYELHSSSVGQSATLSDVQTRIKELGERIRAYRATAQGKDAEVQILIFVTSHGSDYDKTYPTNAIVLGGNTSMPYDQLSSLLYSNLMTKCRDSSCSAVRQRLADEVVVLMDNCFSGGFNDALNTFLKSTNEYRGQIAAPGSKLTRLIALSAAYRQQVATGTIPSTQLGTLVTLFREMLTNWAGAGKDGLVSWYDVKQFVPISAGGHFTEDALDAAVAADAGLVCPALGKRRQLYSFLDENPAYFGRLFANPMTTLKTEMPPAAGAMANNLWLLIQTPVFTSNLTDAMLQRYAFAATSAADAGTSQTAQDFLEAMREKATTAEAKLPAQISLMQKLYQYLKKNPGQLDSSGFPNYNSQPATDSYQTADSTSNNADGGVNTAPSSPASMPVPNGGAALLAPVAGTMANTAYTSNGGNISQAALGLGSDDALAAAYQRAIQACNAPSVGTAIQSPSSAAGASTNPDPAP